VPSPPVSDPALARAGLPRPIVDVRGLRTHIVTRWGTVKAVDGVSFQVAEGETLGLVGESGSGKSLSLLSIPRLLPPGCAITGGAVRLNGQDLTAASDRELRALRGGEIGVIFQASPPPRRGTRRSRPWPTWACPTPSGGPAPSRMSCPAASASGP